MQTNLIQSVLNSAEGREADRILRTCVHCGFCTATCPTYQELGDELDGPRGRIYQIKNLLEGEAPTRQVQTHLDRCLTCLNCETTCPSGVEYHKLIDIGRIHVEQQVPRPVVERLMRWALRQVVPYPNRFRPLLRVGRLVAPLLPATLRDKVPRLQAMPKAKVGSHPRRVILLNNCVEPTLTPNVVAATIRVLDALGIEVIQPGGGCCGADGL